MAAFMTPRDVAQLWACSTRHVRRLCQTGELRAMRSGDLWRIAVADVEAYERRHTASAEPEQQPAPKQTKEVRPPVKVDGFSLPADYEPVFPTLWPGHVATKTMARQSR